MVIDPYALPDSECLANKLGITDPELLMRVAARLVSIRDVQAARVTIPGNYGLAHLQRSTPRSSGTSTSGQDKPDGRHLASQVRGLLRRVRHDGGWSKPGPAGVARQPGGRVGALSAATSRRRHGTGGVAAGRSRAYESRGLIVAAAVAG